MMRQLAGATRGREGGATRGWRESMQQPAGTTRRQEGDTMRGRQEMM